jgi:hypothetical protein
MSAERGTVQKVEAGWAWVKTKRSSACSSCASRHHCLTQGSDQMVVKAQNSAQAQKGDEVELYLSTKTKLKSTAIVYLIPVYEPITGNGSVYVSGIGSIRFSDALSGEPNGFQTDADPTCKTGGHERPINANQEDLTYDQSTSISISGRSRSAEFIKREWIAIPKNRNRIFREK